MKSIRLIVNLILVFFLFGSSVAYSQDFYRLRNNMTYEYMHIENKKGHVELTSKLLAGGMWSSQWSMVPVANNNFVRLKNRWTGDYMHTENKKGIVELSKNLVSGGMWSAQWKIIPMEDNSVIQNRWTGENMYIEIANQVGIVKVAKTQTLTDIMWSDQWVLEKVQ
jgi:hypothetical protein